MLDVFAHWFVTDHTNDWHLYIRTVLDGPSVPAGRQNPLASRSISMCRTRCWPGTPRRSLTDCSACVLFQPGPQPGSRPTPGGYGAVPQSTKGGGTMGIIMPIYTIGIVVFFVYTILKVRSPLQPRAVVRGAGDAVVWR